LANESLGDTVFTEGMLIQITNSGNYVEYRFKLADYYPKLEMLKKNFEQNILPTLQIQKFIL